MPREVVVLGTASQAPTEQRNHNGYVVRFDRVSVLFDPGEGTQRQMLLAGVRTSGIDAIAITHSHGDHCLGLPGVLSRMAMDHRTRPVTLVHGQGTSFMVDHLLALTHAADHFPIHRTVLPDSGGVVALGQGMRLRALPLDHRVPALGYRLEQRDHRRFDGAALEEAGVTGPAVRRLLAEGRLEVDGREVALDDVSHIEPGVAVAFVMDTRAGEPAGQVMDGAVLAIAESTYLDGDEALAESYGHMTAGQAGRLAAAAGVGRLVLTHFSQRYDADAFQQQASVHHADVVQAEDLMVVALP